MVLCREKVQELIPKSGKNYSRMPKPSNRASQANMVSRIVHRKYSTKLYSTINKLCLHEIMLFSVVYVYIWF